MRISALPTGNKFKCNGFEFTKESHNRGMTVINKRVIHRTFKKHQEVEVDNIVYKGKIKRI